MNKMKYTTKGVLLMVMIFVGIMPRTKGIDTNPVFDPCSDTKVQKWDGFTLGLAFSSKQSFYSSSDPNQPQFSPCDTRLDLAGNAEIAIFRPRVDEISLLTINSSFNPVSSGGYMVAFAGRKYAARSPPVFVADSTNTITSFTLVVEFAKGTLQNLYWKKFGCDSCSKSNRVCVDNQDCAMPTSKCKGNTASKDCIISIQLTFSGSDRNDDVLNSWYEMKNMRELSLFNLFSNVKDSFTNGFF